MAPRSNVPLYAGSVISRLDEVLKTGIISHQDYDRARQVLSRMKSDFLLAAPTLSGSLTKRGFRGMRRWVTRWCELRDFELTYYAGSGGRGDYVRGSLLLSHQAKIVDNGDLYFSILPQQDCPEDAIWMLCAPSKEVKEDWLEKLNACMDLLWYISQMKVVRVLGEGAFGTVRESRTELTQKDMAIKELDVSHPRARMAAMREIEVLEMVSLNLNHPNIVKMCCVVKTSRTTISIAMPFLSGGDLFDHIVKQKRFSESDGANVLKQVVSALKALHERNILHLDVKPENLIYASDRPGAPVVLTDFGLAKVVPQKEKIGKAIVGTVGYMAPEILRNRLYSPAADVFGAGVVLFVMLAGYAPFGDSVKDVQGIMERTLLGAYSMPDKYWASVSKDAKDLVHRMLAVDPTNRITIEEILRHPWIQAHVPDVPAVPLWEVKDAVGSSSSLTDSALEPLLSSVTTRRGGPESVSLAVAA